MECLHKISVRKPDGVVWREVPCGQCIACRLNRSSSWAMRIMHEVKMHKGKACFLTLTYNQENAPWVSDFYATLVKKDVQDFLKRLRKKLEPAKIRYYLCGEYGEHYGRPHYHLIVFGLDEITARELVPTCWTYGFVHCGGVTFESAAYVARYCTKLLTGPKKDWYIERNLLPEFSLMSRRPGIGASWLEKYGNEVKTHHSVVVNGKELPPPRYYRDKVYDELDRDIVRDRAADFIVKKAKQLAEDMKKHEGLDVDRIQTRELSIFRSLRKRGG